MLNPLALTGDLEDDFEKDMTKLQLPDFILEKKIDEEEHKVVEDKDKEGEVKGNETLVDVFRAVDDNFDPVPVHEVEGRGRSGSTLVPFDIEFSKTITSPSL
jgi:hypothetical protein